MASHQGSWWPVMRTVSAARAMVLGIFWRGPTRRGAVAGMLAGLSVTMYYLLSQVDGVREVVPDMLLADGLWFGISPISTGVFGVPTGLLVTWLVSLVTRPGRVAVVIPDGL